MSHVSRRDFVKSLAMGTVGLAAAGCATGGKSSQSSADSDPREADFSFVHLTDMHVRSKRKGDEGYRACVETVRALKPLPDFALMGGDLAFDGNYTAKDEFERAIGLYKAASDGLGIPYYNCIGNHDALGWSARRKCAPDDPEIGKIMIMKRLGMDRSYYSFDHKGWHFVILDSIHPLETKDGPSQVPRIGEEQLAWLAKDLGAAGGRPTVVVTHIAAFCNIGQINGDKEAKAVNGMIVDDNKALRTILERHRVRAVLQGHSHMQEDYFYRGVWYLTSPAVSGCWWAGTWNGFPYGYSLFEVRGTKLKRRVVEFAWETHLEPEDELERKKAADYEKERQEQQRLLEAERGSKVTADASSPFLKIREDNVLEL